MRDYKAIISRALKDLEKNFCFYDDPNEVIDSKIGDKEISWYPSYLVECEEEYYMFSPFLYKNILDENEIKEECEDAKILIKQLKDVGVSSKVFFITNSIEDVEAVVKQHLTHDFGILHNELKPPYLDFSIKDSFSLKSKLLTSVLECMEGCNNLKGEIGKCIKNFSKKYLKEQPVGEKEEEIIKNFFVEILSIDDRFKLETTPIDFMRDIEQLINNAGDSIRGHYFHTLNTMVIGFMFIDRFYDKFFPLIKEMGGDLVLEYIWILTSLYHDVGYPMLKYEKISCLMSGLEEDDEKIRNMCKENRKEWLDSKEYRLAVEALDDLFCCIIQKEKGKWVYDGFAKELKETKFKKSIRSSFIEKGAHGVAGSLMLALQMANIIKYISKKEDREFLYRHIFYSSISILFHDAEVRDCFRENSIKKIMAEHFPFSLLLTYVDIIQDDRRDLTGYSSRPDIFKDLDTSNGRIKAVLELGALSESIKKRLFEELKEALSFFMMKKLFFDIPNELKS